MLSLGKHTIADFDITVFNSYLPTLIPAGLCDFASMINVSVPIKGDYHYNHHFAELAALSQ